MKRATTYPAQCVSAIRLLTVPVGCLPGEQLCTHADRDGLVAASLE